MGDLGPVHTVAGSGRKRSMKQALDDLLAGQPGGGGALVDPRQQVGRQSHAVTSACE